MRREGDGHNLRWKRNALFSAQNRCIRVCRNDVTLFATWSYGCHVARLRRLVKLIYYAPIQRGEKDLARLRAAEKRSKFDILFFLLVLSI